MEIALSPRMAARIEAIARSHLGLQGDIEIETKSASNDGDNFLGVVHSLKASGRTADGERRDTRFVLKTSHADPTARGHLQSAEVFDKEIRFYSRILPAFRDLQRRRCGEDQPDLLPFIPECFAAEVGVGGEGDYILMRDMKALGFEMGDRTQGMSREMAFLSFKAIARLHAFSFAMKELDPQAFRELSGGLRHVFFVPEKKEMYRGCFQSVAEGVLEVVRARSPSSASRLERWVAEGFVDGITAVNEADEPLSVINHGDVWVNNVLFRGCPPEEISVLDYQMIQTHSPAIDLLYTMYTSLRKETRDQIYADLLLEYHDTLTSTLRRLGVREDVLSMETLEEHMKKYALYGLNLSVFLAPMMFGKLTEEIVQVTDGDAMSKMAWNHRVFLKDEDIQVLVTDVVDEFVRRGCLED
ncbi:uncharacterized protein LOC124167259 [Ischnura elegans]|uniref:uncharacterized protein LOC124167259 n=1 Tax=Ischnura elegans TaxID=197161 RepID=UPI001ED8B43B|nr:uncharacterized protein LOC124167259 [Ischnura elegans]